MLESPSLSMMIGAKERCATKGVSNDSKAKVSAPPPPKLQTVKYVPGKAEDDKKERFTKRGR